MSLTVGVLSLCIALAASPAAHVTLSAKPGKTSPRWTITVDAGAIDRTNVAVRTLFGDQNSRQNLVLRDRGGAPVPFVVLPDGSISFVVKSLKAGRQVTFTAGQTGKPPRPEKAVVQAAQGPDGISVTASGKPVVRYQGALQPPREVPHELARSGYLHPLVSPAGLTVTADYPAGQPNQHGIWSAWAKVDYEGRQVDFWDPARKQGRVARESMGPVFSGPFLGGFGTHQYFTDLSNRATLMREAWEVLVHRPEAGRRYNLVDLQSTTQAIQGKPVTLAAGSVGGIFLRGNPQWQGAAQSVFLSSEGATRTAAQGAPARWVYLGGKVEGKPVGVAILASPQNPHAPQAVYVDAEAPVLGFAPAKSASISIRPDQPLHLAYRFVVLDGPPDAKLFEELWKDYANPPRVEIKAE